jgi:hypothetical protein
VLNSVDRRRPALPRRSGGVRCLQGLSAAVGHYVSAMSEYIQDRARTLPAACTGRASAADPATETISDFAEHVREIEHIRGAALNRFDGFRVGAHCEVRWESYFRGGVGGERCKPAGTNDAEGSPFMPSVLGMRSPVAVRKCKTNKPVWWN